MNKKIIKNDESCWKIVERWKKENEVEKRNKSRITKRKIWANKISEMDVEKERE